jgi:dienelactone hydrolase
MIIVLVAGPGTDAAGVDAFGPVGAEGTPMRRQAWLLPSPDPMIAARAIVFRPTGAGPFPLAVIAHASLQNPIARAQMPPAEYRALAAFLVARGFAVVVPQRPGHGATGGPYLEDQGGCADADYARAGKATADSIARALDFMRLRPFVRKDGALVIGHSAGGWGALALAARNGEGLARIVAFSPGRGGHADNVPGRVCAPERLIAAAGLFGRGARARARVTWLVSGNDTYFSLALSRRMADAFRAAGGRVDLRELAASDHEGHFLAEAQDGDRMWGKELDEVVATMRPGRR